MYRSRFIKVSVSAFLIMCALYLITPKVYLQTIGVDSTFLSFGKHPKIQTAPNNGDSFQKYDKPVYFNIFKFICSFIPSRQRHEGHLSGGISILSQISEAIIE